jgi:predicted helicase
MASEGLDILALDTLFMLTPKGDVNQSVGRILRKQFNEYIYPPLIVDFIDEIESVKRLSFIRMKLYKSRDYMINKNLPDNLDNLESPELECIPESPKLANINKSKKVEKVDFNKSLF